MTVRWTPEAVATFENIIENINTYWSQKEVAKFIDQTEELIEHIQRNPKMFVATSFDKQIRRGFVSRLTSLFYRINVQNNEIELLSFWDNRQNPEDNVYI